MELHYEVYKSLNRVLWGIMHATKTTSCPLLTFSIYTLMG
jgi:hypothetical protein